MQVGCGGQVRADPRSQERGQLLEHAEAHVEPHVSSELQPRDVYPTAASVVTRTSSSNSASSLRSPRAGGSRTVLYMAKDTVITPLGQWPFLKTSTHQSLRHGQCRRPIQKRFNLGEDRKVNGLAEAMRDARRSSGIKFRTFAHLAGYSESHLRSVENGHRSVTAEVAGAYDRVLATGGVFLASVAADPGKAELDTDASWDQRGTMTVLGELSNRSGVERRAFVTASAATLSALVGNWRTGLGSPDPLKSLGSRQITPSLVRHIDERLDHLRHLDDELGSGDLALLARSELALIARLLRVGRYTDQTSRRLYALAAEASRQVAWTCFDQNQHATAQRYFELALRASATARDSLSGAYALSFLAVQCYSIGQGQQAVSLLETATDAIAGVGTPKMAAMLAARSARALSKTGGRVACARMLHIARDALDRGPHPDDPSTLYWVTHGEIEMIAGSCALDLDDPAEAVRRFDAAISADYRGDDQYPRSHAIYLARAAEAHLALRDVDAALNQAAHALHCLGGVDSARSTSTLASLRTRLAAHNNISSVRDFLEATS